MTQQYDNTNRGALFRNNRKEQDNHPDTIRMSWLYQNGLSKVGKAAIFGANRKIQNIDDLREAIDDERYRSENPFPMNNTHE